MSDFNWWKRTCAVFVVCAATGIAAPAQTLITLANFEQSNGSQPVYLSLAQGLDGNFYGTTNRGGSGNQGTVFRITPDGTLTTLHSFILHDGRFPNGGLILGFDGDLYGTTVAGGAYGGGTVYKITASGKLTVLYSFCSQPSCADGSSPMGALVQSTDGNFFGTTNEGGVNTCGNFYSLTCGTVFEMTPAGKLTTLHSFGPTEGYYPYTGLIQASNGYFYGTTSAGGPGPCSSNISTGCGAVFRITSSGVLTTLHNFENTDGSFPVGALIQATTGMLYGTTVDGGTYSDGTVFSLTPAGALTVLHSFDNTDGRWPYAGLVQGSDGSLLGTTIEGGLDGLGTIFAITPAGDLTTLFAFDGTDGSEPWAPLAQGTDGNFYGTTYMGGSGGYGTVFSFSTGIGPFVGLLHNPAKIRQPFGILGQGFTGTTSVLLNGISASFTVVSDTLIKATVPAGATTGYVTVTTPSGPLTSNVPFRVIK